MKYSNLLLISKLNDKIRRYAYFNLKTLEKNKKYFEIIAYESRNLFDNNQDWEDAFRRVLDENYDDFYSIICELIKICGEKNNESNIKYCFILDEIEFDSTFENKINFKNINYIRNSISKTNNCYLLGCCSLSNDKVKDLLLNQRYYYNGENSFYLEYFTSFIHSDIDKQIKDNKYLKMLGNLPKYIYFKDKLNMKILNLIKKRIKNDIVKFYDRKKQLHLSLSDLEKIDVNKFYENRYDFKEFLKKIPIQYFNIDKLQS